MPKYPPFLDGPGERPEFNVDLFREAMRQVFADTGAFNEKLQREGHFVFADGLEPATTATTVDGPNLEAKEYLDSLWGIDVPILNVAQVLAADGAKTCRDSVEQRPHQTEDSVPVLLKP